MNGREARRVALIPAGARAGERPRRPGLEPG